MKIGVVVHGPNVIDSGYALKLINLLGEYGEVKARLGGTMGRTAVIDAGLENVIDISRKLVPSDCLKIFHDNHVDVIFLLNYGKSDVTGQVFGYKVYNHYIEKISDNNIAIIQIERPGEDDGSIICWNHELDISYELSEKLDLAIITPQEVYDNHIRQDDAGVNQRIVHGVSPGENIMVNSVVIGKTNSDKLTLIARDNHIVDIRGGELKPHGLEKLGNEVILAEAYKSLFPMDEDAVRQLIEKIGSGKINAITFTSPLTVENFFEIGKDKSELADLLNDNLLTVCIGPITAKVLEKYGVSHIYPDTYTVPDMMELLFKTLEKR